ncbi:MAG: hypothetical protein R3B96_15320 [Pirellulaceae bacterium]
MRLSGKRALEVAREVFEPLNSACWPPSHAALVRGRRFVRLQPTKPESLGAGRGGALDDGRPIDLFVWPSDRSFTREPVVEFHWRAGPRRVERLIVSCVAALRGPRSEAEFTLRAFLAGRIDLTRGSGVGCHRRGNANELRTGLDQLAGRSPPLQPLRETLLGVLADLEAGLDFVDEDIEFVERRGLACGASRASTSSRVDRSVPRTAPLGTRASSRGVSWGLQCRKSTLFNALVKNLRIGPLVSDQPRTTRRPPRGGVGVRRSSVRADRYRRAGAH